MCKKCREESLLEHLKANVRYWCGTCTEPRECAACQQKKREQRLASMAESKARSQSGYFRPFHAEHWWQQRAMRAVKAAIKRGIIPDLKGGEYACVDCGGVATEYEHRDYSRPYDVEPVCRGCNSRRGTAKWPTAETFQFVRLDARKAA